MRSTQPSLPPSEPAHSRHLGAGSRGDRAVRAQLVIALVALLVMVAVPLYLLRRPRVESRDPKASTSADTKGTAPGGALSPLATGPAGAGFVPPASSAQPRGINLGDTKILRCQKGNSKVPPEQCDRQPFFEEALVKAIRDNAACVAAASGGGTVSYVLDIDHKRKKSHAWAGKSGTMKKRAAKEAVSCVNKSLPTPDWAQIPHQHERYQLAVIATYPAGGAGDPPP